MNYQDQVQKDFEYCEAKINSHKKQTTGVEDVLQFLIDHPERIWWWSWEFVGKKTSKGGYLSHRAPARASDLAIHYPELVEDRRVGRYKVYRAKLENKYLIDKWL